MSQLAREELAEILFQEIGSYLPNIQRGITDLYLDGSNEDVLYEVHRLFHNIKGAASQVAFLSLSKTAAVCEAVSGALLEQKKSPVDHLDFLASTTVEIEAFCFHDNKITDVEDSLFGRTADAFTELVGRTSSTIEVIIPESLRTAINQSVLPMQLTGVSDSSKCAMNVLFLCAR